MLKSFYEEAQVTVGDDTLRLVVNMRTIDATENLVGMPMPELLKILFGPANMVPMALLGKLVWGLCREHNPEITLDQALFLSCGEAGAEVGVTVGDLVRRTFHIGEEAKGEENPPKRRGRSKTS